jgi:hypothetical protein
VGAFLKICYCDCTEKNKSVEKLAERKETPMTIALKVVLGVGILVLSSFASEPLLDAAAAEYGR